MRKFKTLCLAATMVAVAGTAAQADTYVAGQVAGIWTTSGSPYMVLADIEIPYGLTLTIEPGVQVLFTGNFKFIAHGTLTAIGTPADSILLSHHLPYPSYLWRGIFFEGTQGTSELAYCRIEWGYAQGSVGQSGAKGGGAHILNTSVNIHNCIFTNNKADIKGGAIYLNTSNSEIRDNLITSNVCNDDGGGIYLDYCSYPVIQGNLISFNSADVGAGIYYTYSGGICEGNGIHHNSASPNGGGIVCDHSAPLIQQNTINYNTSSSSSGTGIYCHHSSSPIIRYNEICFNNYTAIYCGDNSSPTIDNNTVYGNNSYAIRLYLNSNPIGRNNVIVGNQSQFYVPTGCSLYMTYSDVQGGWPGIGNINLQPFFVEPATANFNLMPYSPCIDAGSPLAPLDPDGTIADQGAHYFDQNQPQGICTLTLNPLGAPIVLPPSGGIVWFTAIVSNSPENFNLFDGWYNLQQPDMQIIPMLLRTGLYLAPGGTLLRTLNLSISASAMPGVYTVTGYVGDNPNVIESFDSFTFEKLPAGGDEVGGGAVIFSDGEVTQAFALKSTLPERTELLGVYPEPFNPSATIAFSLGKTEHVRLEIYRINGQKVTTLLDQEMAAGVYRQVFEGADLPSGVYLYFLRAGSGSVSGKMTLMK